MNGLAIIALSACVLCGNWVYAADVVKTFRADATGAISLDGAPVHVKNLIELIRKTDMNRLLLSEDKRVRWHVTRIEIVADDLILIELDDGHGGESILCDYNHKHEWNIIRRVPIGDWKPKNERSGERISVIPIPTLKAEQGADGNPN